LLGAFRLALHAAATGDFHAIIACAGHEPSEKNPMNYTVRLARETDLEHLPAIELAAATLFAAYERFQHLLSDAMSVEEHRALCAAGRLWVTADENNQPVGFAAVELVDGHPHIQELDVHPHHGRRGLGSAMIEAVCEWARANGYTAITLTTERDILWNAPYYARLGFEILPQAEWGADMCAIAVAEIAHGLNPETRVAMIRRLAVPPEG
jgi:GNAT superfamily N-acetyltransferase